jgi:ABC-type uncharacterized transport system
VSGLALAGWIALAFAAGSYSAVGRAGWFTAANAAFGLVALAVAAVRAAARARGQAPPASRGALLRGLAGVALVTVGAIAFERLADATGWQADWSFEQRQTVSPATLGALAELAPVEATLFRDAFDPRARSTRLLLRHLAETGHLAWREKLLDEAPEDVDRFEIRSSNSVVLQAGGRFEVVDRPSEGTLYEALYHLRRRDLGVVYTVRGAGEGELDRTDGAGYSGLAAALGTEGYKVRELVAQTGADLPADAAGLLIVGPQRPWRPEALAALGRYLARGGRLIAFLEPGTESGVETVLAEWGMTSSNDRVVDPASGPMAGEAPGWNPLVFGYADHPLARGLDDSRMTFFPGARSFVLRKPRPDDSVGGVAFTSGRSWLTPAASFRPDLTPQPTATADVGPHAVVAAGRYPRDAGETRIVAFGDAGLASNHFLRTVYNLDLVLNAVHWALAREPEITIRPKAVVTGRLQLPLPVQDSFTMFQGVGLLLPELLLLGAAWAWARGRGA